MSNHVRRRTTFVIYGIFGVTTLLCTIGTAIPRAGPVCDIFITLYYANALFQFVNLVVDYHGDRDTMMARMKDKQIPLAEAPCCCIRLCRNPQIKCNLKNIRLMEFMMWQNSVVRFATTFVGVVIRVDTGGGLKSASTLITVVNVISTITAIYGGSLYVAASDEFLKQFQLRKFFGILKVCIILFNLQSSVFALLAGSGRVIKCTSLLPAVGHASLWSHTALTVEMAMLSIVTLLQLGPSKNAAYDKYPNTQIHPQERSADSKF